MRRKYSVIQTAVRIKADYWSYMVAFLSLMNMRIFLMTIGPEKASPDAIIAKNAPMKICTQEILHKKILRKFDF